MRHVVQSSALSRARRRTQDLILWAILFTMAATLTGPVAWAGPTIEFVGCLKDATGVPMPDGLYRVQFKLYSSATRMAPVWESEGVVEVEVVDGCYAHALGSRTPLPKYLSNYSTVWVGVAMAGGAEIFPRAHVQLDGHAATADGSPSDGHSRSSYKPKSPFPDVYFHAGISAGLGRMSGGERYEQMISPWQTGTGAGYGLTLAAGFRNFCQLQFRPRITTSSDLNRFQADSVVPLDYHVKNEMVAKVNVLFFKKSTSARVPVLFLTYGRASEGSVRQVDKVGTGFVDGSSTMLGLEAGVLHKISSFSFYIERRSTTFRNFYYEPIGTFQEEVTATFWSVGIQAAFGTGFQF